MMSTCANTLVKGRYRHIHFLDNDEDKTKTLICDI